MPDAVALYRKTLAAADDKSVVISSIGMTTNMRDLMQSGPDQFSDLNGRDLVQKKIKKIIWMDGMYNFGCAEHDTYDWLGDDAGCRGSAKEALESIFGCCSEIEHIFNPVDVGEKVDTGAKLSTCASENNPCR